MAVSEMTKPATAETVNGLRKIEHLGGRLESEDSERGRQLQVLRLTRRFTLSAPLAIVLAHLAYGEDAR